MLSKAYFNKNQPKNYKFYLYPDYLLEEYDTVHSLIDTVPFNCLQSLHQFIERHDIFLPSVLPKGEIETNYKLDIKNAIFNGPFLAYNQSIVAQ